MSTNLTIRNKELILDLPDSFEIDYNAFNGEQRINTVLTAGARWLITSDTVDVSLGNTGKFLRYSIPSNVSNNDITHTVTYKNLRTSEESTLEILQTKLDKIYEPYDGVGFFKTSTHFVYEIEFVKISGFEFQIILDRSDIIISNNMFTLHSIVQKKDPIIRVQVLRSHLTEEQSTDVSLTINGIVYSKTVTTKIDPMALPIPRSSQIEVKSTPHPLSVINLGFPYKGKYRFKANSPHIHVKQEDKVLKLNVSHNRSFDHKKAKVDIYIDEYKIHTIDVVVKPGVIAKSAIKTLNKVRIDLEVAKDTYLRISDIKYLVDGKIYNATCPESYLIGTGTNDIFECDIDAIPSITDGGNISFKLEIGTKFRYFNLNTT